MPHPLIQLQWVGDRHLTVSFAPAPNLRAQVAAATTALNDYRPTGTLDIVPAESTILLTFNALALDPITAQSQVATTLRDIDPAHPITPARTIDIPICYGGAHGPDLDDVAHLCHLTPDQFIAAHLSADHTVAFLGFAPGFAYISGLPPALHVPRLSSPRRRVPVGSIGIAGDKSGIYPREGPGGWRLIGRTPIRMFDVHRPEPALLRAGDRVRFLSISESEFHAHREAR